MANSFPGSGLAYADAFSVGTANAAASSLYVASSCVQAVRIEHGYNQTNLHHNTLWLRATNSGANLAASIGFTVVNNGGDHHRANIAATANSGQIGGNLALYTRNNNGNDTLGYFQDHAGNVGIGTTDFTNVAFGSPSIHAAGSRATLGLSSTNSLATIALTAGSCSQTALHINHADDGTTSFYNYRYGGQAFTFTGLGRLGINTSSPSTPLQIRDSSVSSGGSGLSVYGFDGAMEVYTTRAESPANAAIYLYNRPTSGTNGTGTGISFRASSSNTADRPQGGLYSSWTDTTDATRTSKFFFDLVCGGTYATRMTLLGNGNLGLSTTTPRYSLDVAGGMMGNFYMSCCNSTLDGTGPYDYGVIGTGNIAGALLVNDIVGARYSIAAGSYNLTFRKSVRGTSTACAYCTVMTFLGTSDSNCDVHVNIANRLGLGTSPSYKLDIAGTSGATASMRIAAIYCGGGLGLVHLTSSGTEGGTITYEKTSGTTQKYKMGLAGDNCFFIYNETAGNQPFTLTPAGNFGFGITAPSYKLHVNGTFYAAGSSIKYKEGICKYNTDSCLFMCLKPVTYQYKDEFKHLGKELKSETQIGLIAEDVAEVYPELAVLVNEEDNKVVRNVDYEKLSIILLSEVQKLRKELDELKIK
jgi:hypothetical protein